MEPPSKKRRWTSQRMRRRRISSSSAEEDHHIAKAAADAAMIDSNATTLISLPSELQQDIFLHILRPCLEDYIDGEKHFRDTVDTLATASRVTRGNIVAAIKMIRLEITHLPKFGCGDIAARKCNHLSEMRILVLTLEYNLTTGSRIPIKIGRFRKIPRESDWKAIAKKVDEVGERALGAGAMGNGADVAG
jgi:hypothetical protein